MFWISPAYTSTFFLIKQVYRPPIQKAKDSLKEKKYCNNSYHTIKCKLYHFAPYERSYLPFKFQFHFCIQLKITICLKILVST